MRVYARHACSLAATLALAWPLHAQRLPDAQAPARVVTMFNVFCLSQLPDLNGVTRAAGFGEFAPITGAELEQYRPQEPAEELHAWRFHDSSAEYVLTAARTKPNATFKKEVPAFANSTNVACSLMFPATAPEDAMLKELLALLGRAPDETWDEGQMRVHAWSGQTDRLMSHVQYMAPVKAGPTGVLSASTYVKY